MTRGQNMDSRVLRFFQENSQSLKTPSWVEPVNSRGEIVPEPYTPWYPLWLPNFPAERILAEARALDPYFVEHRPGEGHQGWMGLAIHGISSTYTAVHPSANADSSMASPVYTWTEIAQDCPATVAYFSRVFPAVAYERIRFMKVKAGGYILPHKDKDEPGFGPLAIPLNVPKDCHYILQGFGRLPVKAGEGLLVDISHFHAIVNFSNEDRYHLIVEKHCGEKFPQFRDLFVETRKRLLAQAAEA